MSDFGGISSDVYFKVGDLVYFQTNLQAVPCNNQGVQDDDKVGWFARQRTSVTRRANGVIVMPVIRVLSRSTIFIDQAESTVLVRFIFVARPHQCRFVQRFDPALKHQR